MSKIPTLEEQIITFLDKWECVRVAQLQKYQLVIDQLKHSPGFRGRWGAHAKVEHYQHELTMLRVLRARFLGSQPLPPVPPIPTDSGGIIPNIETVVVTAKTATPACGSKVFDAHHED